MGQCASCGSARQSIESSSGPNSPSVEFNPADLFQSTSWEQKKTNPEFQSNTRRQPRIRSPLYVSQIGGTFELEKPWLRPKNKTGRSRSENPFIFRKSISSPRRKLKTVTFSEPIVRTFEPSGKLQFNFSKIRLTSKPKRSSITANPDLRHCQKLLVSTFEVNGKESDENAAGDNKSGMGNNTSGTGSRSSQAFSCVTEANDRKTSFKTHPFKESSLSFNSIATSPSIVSEHSELKFESSQSGINLKTSECENESISSNLNELEARRKHTELLRYRFFSTPEPAISTSSRASISETDMNSNMNGFNHSRPGFLHKGSSTDVPDKVKRTFNYRQPSTAPATPVDTNSNELPKLYSINQSSKLSGNSKMSKLNSAPALGATSKIPSLRSKSTTNNGNANSGRTPSSTSAQPPAVGVTSNKKLVFSNSIPESRSGVEESFRKSATFHGNINGDSNNYRRASAPPKCLPQRRHITPVSATKVFPTNNLIPVPIQRIGSTDNEPKSEGRRFTLFGPTSKLTPENSGLKKPVESKPFYTIGLYQFKSPRPVNAEFPSVLQNQPLTTGLVTQRKLFYQSKSVDTPKVTPLATTLTTMRPNPNNPTKTTPNRFGLSRSATWVRGKNGEIRPDDKGEHTDQPELLTRSSPAPACKQMLDDVKTSCILDQNNEILKSKGIEEELAHVEFGSIKCSSCYQLEHTNSTTSTSSILGLGTDGPSGDANVISDSEFLIDDEISDQPELTLTYKDSPHRLSRSSSGESLLSCDLMLDLSLKDSLGLGPCELEVTSDSAISDVSSSIQTSLESQSANSNGQTKNSVLPRRTNRTASPLFSTPLSSKPNSKFGSRNSPANGSSGIPQTYIHNPGIQNHQVEALKNKSPFKTQDKKSALCPEKKQSLNSVNKSPIHGAKLPNRVSSTNRDTAARLRQNLNGTVVEKANNLEDPSRLVISDLSNDVALLKEQLQVLKGILVEQEILQSEKDETIQILRQEIEILKRGTPKKKIHDGGGDTNRNKQFSNFKHNTEIKCCCKEGKRESNTNAASQTDSTYKNSDLVHPHELNGRLVSFWIGRRSYSSYNSTITFAT